MTTRKSGIFALMAFAFLGLPLSDAFAQDSFSRATIGTPPSLKDTALPVSKNVSPRSPEMQVTTSGLPQAPESAVVTQENTRKKIREQAFDAAVTGLLPLEPDEIREVLKQYDKVQEAVEVPIYPYPHPEIKVETVSLDPGSTPPVIKMAPNHVTTVSIMDVTGAPWPIQDMSWAGNFEITNPEEGGNIIRIIPFSNFAHGNMSMRLLDLDTPVIFTLETGRDTVQYRFDARIPEYGPMASAPLIEGGISIKAGSSLLNMILDGVPPTDAEKLSISGINGRTSAYSYAGKTYVRTPLTLLSPGWDSSVSSADGMHVYALSNAPVILLSDNGRIIRAILEEGNSSDE